MASTRGTLSGRLLIQDAIFQRLAEDRIFNQIPSILITAKGYPDISTRFLLHRLTQKFPELPILALVDWNPAGIATLCIFQFGSVSMGLEAYRYACNVQWLGLRMSDLQQIPSNSLEQLKPRDQHIAKSSMTSKMLPLSANLNRRSSICPLQLVREILCWRFNSTYNKFLRTWCLIHILQVTWC